MQLIAQKNGFTVRFDHHRNEYAIYITGGNFVGSTASKETALNYVENNKA